MDRCQICIMYLFSHYHIGTSFHVVDVYVYKHNISPVSIRCWVNVDVHWSKEKNTLKNGPSLESHFNIVYQYKQFFSLCRSNAADTRRRINVGLTLVHRLRRCANVKPAFIQRLVSSGNAGTIATFATLAQHRIDNGQKFSGLLQSDRVGQYVCVMWRAATS